MENLEAKQGKYLTFSLGSEEYGLEILKVREIIGYMNITVVPQTPFYVKGVINLRGQVIPVIDLRLKFGMEEADVTEQTCIIVVEINTESGKFQTGVIVDGVSEVLDIKASELEEPPQMGNEMENTALLAMAKVNSSVKILLDIDKVVSPADLHLADTVEC
jgi:purine-binding chemotaxis protein CheW